MHYFGKALRYINMYLILKIIIKRILRTFMYQYINLKYFMRNTKLTSCYKLIEKLESCDPLCCEIIFFF